MNRNPLRQWLFLTCTMLCSLLWPGAQVQAKNSLQSYVETLLQPSALTQAKSPMQLYVEATQPGINLGNTLDAIPDETSWGNPPITQELLQAYANAGYKSVRIPITWTAYIGPGPTYTVDSARMDRVQQVVDWALGAGLYVMINLHHDSWQWISSLPADPTVTDKYSAVWTQISQRFVGYPNKLMFESINEPQFANVDDATARVLLDDLNTVFVNIVRGTGGMNATRPLVLPCLNTNTGQENLDSLAATIANLNDQNLITTFHFYGFWPFSVNNSGYTKFNGPSIDNIVQSFDAVYNTFVSQGVPAIVGELGLLSGNPERGESLKYHEYVTQYSRLKGMTHMLWDTGSMIDRSTYAVKDPYQLAIMMQTLTGRATTADTDMIFVSADEESQNAKINLNLNGNHFVSLKDGSTLLLPGIDYNYNTNGSVLTIKKRRLARYAAAPYGEKAVLTVNVDSGPAWQLHVRYASTPVLSSASGTAGGNLVIPTAFNGDQLEAMEALRADGSYAGPMSWTRFKAWGDFTPDYTNNTITISKDFFTEEPAGTIELKFHFWSGRVATYQLTLQSGGSSSGPDWSIYDNSLAAGWQNWSWATVDTANTTVSYSAPSSISVDAGAWGSLYLAYQGDAVDTSGYNTLVFWANGGPSGGQKITISAAVNFNGDGLPSYTIDSLPANTWQKYEIPLSTLGVQGAANITSFGFMNTSGVTEPTFYLDEIKLSPNQSSTVMRVTGIPTTETPSIASFKVRYLTVEEDDGSSQLKQKVRVRNTGTQPAVGPIYLVLDGMSLNTSLVDPVGLTGSILPAGNPYIIVTPDILEPGDKAKATLNFTSPVPGGDVTYTPRVLSDGLTP
ncbi:cellulase family glycosylhydrolase [Hydrocarboniphaga sp.]|uniref:cellulase family glycosylhydrolase n=1 Tax=Hydrocarboniphaga sp. TaxID=2033016 RepID=UPI003D117687